MMLKNGDSKILLKELPSESVDCVITDCPYHIIAGGVRNNPNEPTGVLRKKFKSDGTACSNKRLKNNESVYIAAVEQGKMFDFNDIKFEEWLPDVYRVLKEGCHCYIMINSRNLKELQQKAENVGFKFQNLLAWRKNNATPSQFYMQQMEFILLLRKGKARYINNKGTMNCLDVPNILGGKKLHPTEKPVRLMKIMVENSTNKGDIVLDPFMGAGSTGVACMETGRDFIGFEIDKEFFDIAKSRIEKTKEGTEEKQFLMF